MDLCCVNPNAALRYACDFLAGFGFSASDQSSSRCRHLLLPVPIDLSSRSIIEETMAALPDGSVVTGGKLGNIVPDRLVAVDLLDDPYYLYENAAITAKCAVSLAPKTGRILILGFGRIGKMLCKELFRSSADLFIAARKESDRALAHALGFHAIPISDAQKAAPNMDVIFNTVPEMVLPDLQTKPGATAIDLASEPGMSGANVIVARGLPNKMMPEVSGNLIARSFIRLSLGKENVK